MRTVVLVWLVTVTPACGEMVEVRFDTAFFHFETGEYDFFQRAFRYDPRAPMNRDELDRWQAEWPGLVDAVYDMQIQWEPEGEFVDEFFYLQDRTETGGGKWLSFVDPRAFEYVMVVRSDADLASSLPRQLFDALQVNQVPLFIQGEFHDNYSFISKPFGAERVLARSVEYIPEPSSLMLLLLSGCGPGVLRVRRKSGLAPRP